MINAIKSDSNLAPFIKQKSECCFDGKPEQPYIDEIISDDSVVVLAPDDYYNSLHLGDTPPSIDHLVTLERHNKSYAHFLIEDKNVKSAKGIDVKNIRRKFETTLQDFMTKRFGQIFLDNAYPIRFMELYLVTNPTLKKPREKGKRTGDNMRLELLLLLAPCEFRGIVVSIKHSYPEALVKMRDV
ncbi:MAG: hypothetical protein FWF87_09015 [Synergistaceae bacterium]|nr:hypothetical protein [Synergistaceae bacterium]